MSESEHTLPSMRFEFTIRRADGDRDIAVLSSVTATLADIRQQLATLLGLPHDATLTTSGRPLAPSSPIGLAAVRTGSVIDVDAIDQPAAPSAVTLHVVGGVDAGRAVALRRGRVSIGRSTSCDVMLHDDRASRVHAVLEVGAGALTLHDHASTNGTFVDDEPVGSQGREVRPGQLVRVGDTLLSVRTPDDTAATLVPSGDALLVIRPPRRDNSATGSTIDRVLDLPRVAPTSRPRPAQWLTALLPAAAAGGLAWFTHSAVFLLFGLLSPVMMAATTLGDRVHWRRSRRRAGAAYRHRRRVADEEIARAVRAEASELRRRACDPGAIAAIAGGPASRLWERRPGDDDHLVVRLGTGERPSRLHVRDTGDPRPAAVLSCVPIVVDLRDGPLGVAGPSEVISGLVRWLVCQLAVLHSPSDVRLALFLSGELAEHWSWVRWLPHVQGRVALGPDEWRSLATDLGADIGAGVAAEIDRRGNDRTGIGRTGIGRPGGGGPSSSAYRGRWTVAVIDRAAGLADATALTAHMSGGRAAGITAICVDTDAGALPISCANIALVSGETGSRIVLRSAGQVLGEAVVDRVDARWSEHVARALAPLVDAGAGTAGGLPIACDLLEVLGDAVDSNDVDSNDADSNDADSNDADSNDADSNDADVARVLRWWALSDGRPTTVLGRDSDGVVRVDLAADGPHVLIAGTTGAGKSELLRSLVVGLALLHPPDELTFLLIDYKGGAAFGECAGLPHVAGSVTDLDGHLTRRALSSLHAELRRRERLFATARAGDLDAYRAGTPPEPLARLVIVVDEFATLVDELPEFVRGLVGVAQRGRSLGVHLVLATQRPGTAVSPEIRANTSLRIALRVLDAAQSRDIVDAPDAATIARSTPGRAYLRSGPSLRLFQAARVGGPRAGGRSGPTVIALDEWRRPPSEPQRRGDPELSRIVSVIATSAVLAGRRPARSPWRDPLPADLSADALGSPGPRHSIPFARLDLPGDQAQPTLCLDLLRPVSWLVIGGPRSGRTTALSSVLLGCARALSPAEIEVYVVDASGPLASVAAGLAHVATCLGPPDLGSVESLLRHLVRRARAAPAERTPPPALLVVDDWDKLVAGLEPEEAALCQDLIAELARGANAAASTVLITGQRTVLVARFAGNFERRLVLRLGDPGDYALAGIAPRDVATSLPPGRGMLAENATEFQIAYRGGEPSTDAAIRAATAAAWPGARAPSSALRLRPLPSNVARSDLPVQAESLRLGIAGDRAEPLAIDPFAPTCRWLIAGPPRSGRTTALRTLLAEADRLALTVIVAAPARSPLVEHARALGHRIVSPADGAATVGDPPSSPMVLLLDDLDAFLDTPAGDRLTGWVRSERATLAVFASGRADELATTYRGIAAEVRRERCGLLLRPGPGDGELFGIRVTRRAQSPPGRGFVIGAPGWSLAEHGGSPVPIQVALP